MRADQETPSNLMGLFAHQAHVSSALPRVLVLVSPKGGSATRAFDATRVRLDPCQETSFSGDADPRTLGPAAPRHLNSERVCLLATPQTFAILATGIERDRRKPLAVDDGCRRNAPAAPKAARTGFPSGRNLSTCQERIRANDSQCEACRMRKV